VRPTAIAAYWRTFAHDRVLALHNLSGQVQAIEMEILSQPMIDLLTGTSFSASDQITLNPYQFLWLQPRES